MPGCLKMGDGARAKECRRPPGATQELQMDVAGGFKVALNVLDDLGGPSVIPGSCQVEGETQHRSVREGRRWETDQKMPPRRFRGGREGAPCQGVRLSSRTRCP